MSHGPFAPVTGEQPVTSPLANEDKADADRTWFGYVSVVTGALGLSVIAIVFGHLGLRAVRRGDARRREFALAGTILGYIGLVAGAGAAWWLLYGPQVQETRDALVQADVIALGSAIATEMIDGDDLPTVYREGDTYVVESDVIEAHYLGETTLSLVGTRFDNWCVSLAFSGGSVAGFSYTATGGVTPGVVCDVPAPVVEPTEASSPTPSATPTETPAPSLSP